MGARLTGRSPYWTAHAAVAAITAAVGFGFRWRALASSIAPTQPFFGGIAARAASRLADLLAAARLIASRSACAFACARACTTLLNEGKYDRLECEELVLSAMFVNTFPQLTEWILDKYTTIAALLTRFDTELGEKKAADEITALARLLKDEGLDEVEGSNSSSLHGRGVEHE